ncbi:MAG TPA: HDIG domain-containing protein [Phycisphaerales bacterium]|nr:HDIG domain-containing protein [Phycisphaerales bacterium]HMP35902.1 HDIG domain-containing protein [Phycisphaerales bacterium]
MIQFVSRLFRPRKGVTAKRREGIRRTLPRPVSAVRDALRQPEIANCLVAGGVATVALAVLLHWSVTTPKFAVGQVAAESRVVRIGYRVADPNATALARDEARKTAPRVYVANVAYLRAIADQLHDLPRQVAGRLDVDGIEPQVIQAFGLDKARIDRLQAFAPEIAPARHQEWRRWVDRLLFERLIRNPLLDPVDFNVARGPGAPRAIAFLPPPDVTPEQPSAISAGVEFAVDGEATPFDRNPRVLVEFVRRQAVEVGVDDPELLAMIVAPILADPRPTLLFNDVETGRRRELAVERVPEQFRTHAAGEFIFLRGDTLSDTQVQLATQEAEQYFALAPARQLWLMKGGFLGLSAMLMALLGTYLVAFHAAICRRPARVAGLFALVVGLSGIALAATIELPSLLIPVATGTCIVGATIVALAYDRRFAMFVVCIQCLVTAVLLERGPSFFVAMACGSAAMIVQLGEVRHRGALIRASVVTALVVGVGIGLASLVRLAGVPDAGTVALSGALWAAGASVASGFFMLGVMPTLEKTFDITTGLTLAELRDPRQPLLRQLQQKAPGSYNHSLQIANIAEAAAEAIGANGLLVYVGALYHDIGKMNKPEYFVENQVGGLNKHDRLSPTMSLLVIVGHVKDGIELAKEYRLPKSIRQFIETHHGTTLVEFFYHAAKSRAEATGEGEESVSEIAYRYPGPRPQTREAAILMIADAVESATRAMTEPTPGRIEQLVRTLSRRRLEDGQFDECDLTLRELTLIEESIIKSVCAIYHGRISYPGTASVSAKTDVMVAPGSKIA